MTHEHGNALARMISARLYDERTINEALNRFLGIHSTDLALIARYRAALLEGAERFVQSFYDYLWNHPDMATVLNGFRQEGGDVDGLLNKQLAHFRGLLAGDISDNYAARLAHIGLIHYQQGIDPAWMMGAYLLYLEHVSAVIRHSKAIAAADRNKLERVVDKLLFRDMGLMLEGYWRATTGALQHEQQAVAELQHQVTSLLTNLPQILWSVDVLENRPLYVSPTTREICDIDIDMPIPCLGWTVPDDRDTVRSAWAQALAGNVVEVESRVLRPGGELRWFRRVFHPFKDDHGRVVRIDGLMEDSTDAKETVERLHQLATTDSLTGLYNRTLFRDRLSQAIVSAGRRPGCEVALMIMDLDHFKEINDTVGHPVGDAILSEVARRLRAVVSETDTLARLGGDEFAILLPDVRSADSAVRQVAHKIHDCFLRPFKSGDDTFYLGVGIGVAVFPDHGDDVDTLMSRADVAMYGAKHKDVGFAFYDAASDPHRPEHLQLAADLRRAVERQEFVVHYQPKIDLRSGRVSGVEALVRWQHPQHGLLFPDRFIALAERSGLINPITDWVLATALAQCRAWSQLGHPLAAAVNMSGRTFHQADLALKVEALIRQSGVAPHCLEIEVTENILMADIERGAETLDQLSAIGVVISIDDYGTGHSSLARLKKLPLQALKIDKSFIMQMAHDENDAIIVRSTIDLAHNLGCRVIAEGVEDREVFDILTMLGADEAQGYFISHPVPAEQLGVWLRESSWGAGGPARP